MSHKKQTKFYGCAPDDQLPLSNPVSRAYVLLPLGFIDLARRDTASRIITDVAVLTYPRKIIIPQAGRTCYRFARR